MTESDSPCRLFVYLAKDAPLAAVLRRGPSDWARLSLWHTDTDVFEHGQWLKGRVYERRCDISADGSLFVAFVRQSGGREAGPPAKDTWVAVSRMPYFTALALWFAGGTYHTGAFFPDAASLWLGYLEETAPDVGSEPDWLSITPPRDIAYINRSPEWTDRTVHFNRLLRDGWQVMEKQDGASLWEKRHSILQSSLIMLHQFESFTTYGGPYTVEYILREDSGLGHPIGLATWADWDQQGRLVVAREGRLWRWDAAAGSLQEIADFNPQTPDPQPAPHWARVWPRHAS